MKVELLDAPYGINSKNPTFGWELNSKNKRCNQKAYQVVFSKTKTSMKNKDYFLDTGWVESANNTAIKVDGLEECLEDNSIFWWSVRVKDENGIISSFSDAEYFTTAVGNEWKSVSGIWNSEMSDHCFLRTVFDAPEKEIEKAILSVTALSPESTRQYVFNMFMKGEYVGSGPARLKGDTINYNTFDVTQYIKRNNVLGAICYTNESKMFLAQLTFFYTDGSKEIISNSGRDINAWHVLNGDESYGKSDALISTSYYTACSENINAVEYPNEWMDYKYDDSGWENAVVVNKLDSQKMYSYQTENMQKFYISPETVTYMGNDHYFVDLGKEIVGGIKIEIGNSLKKETQLTFRYGEEIEEDGSVKYQMRTGNVYEEIWTLSTGKNELENLGIKTFRYIDVYSPGITIKKDNIKGCEIRQPFNDDAADLTSSEKLLNDIYELSKYTIKMTNQNLYVDSQSRERDAYEGDVWINMIASYAVSNNYTLARRSLEYLEEKRTWPAEYPMYAIMCAWEDFLYTGDDSSLVENYDKLIQNMDGIIVDKSCWLIRNNYDENGYNRPLVDWPENERDGFAYDDAEYNAVVNAMGAYAYQHLAQIAKVLGKDSDFVQFTTISTKIKESMIAKMYNEEKGMFADGLNGQQKRIEHYSQHATAYALYAGIFNDSRMRDCMIGSIIQTETIKMSVFGSYFLLDGLYKNNAGAYATDLLLSDKDSHTWSYMINNNKATITAEAWSTQIKENMTYSHPWGASPAALITQGIFGIIPTQPGFDEFQVKLQPGKIKKAAIDVPTNKGEIHVSYSMDKNDQFKRIEIIVPANTNAIVSIPVENIGNQDILLDDRAEKFKEKDNFVYKTLNSGTHVIELQRTDQK